MDRWDIYCQACSHNIGDYATADPAWYHCTTDDKDWKRLLKLAPKIRFRVVDGRAILPSGSPEGLAETITKYMRQVMADTGNQAMNYVLGSGRSRLQIRIRRINGRDSTVGTVIYWPDQEVAESELRKKHGIIKYKHGGGRTGHAYCVSCAKKLNYKCPICGGKLSKVKAENHPGGHWGIRGQRAPGRMRF